MASTSGCLADATTTALRDSARDGDYNCSQAPDRASGAPIFKLCQTVVKRGPQRKVILALGRLAALCSSAFLSCWLLLLRPSTT